MYVIYAHIYVIITVIMGIQILDDVHKQVFVLYVIWALV